MGYERSLSAGGGRYDVLASVHLGAGWLGAPAGGGGVRLTPPVVCTCEQSRHLSCTCSCKHLPVCLLLQASPIAPGSPR
eukprot:1158337-Pelagomonas_calceolata.AAC.1